MSPVRVMVTPKGRYALKRGGETLPYDQLASELPIQLWPLPGFSTYGVRVNADAAAQALNLRLVPEKAVA